MRITTSVVSLSLLGLNALSGQTVFAQQTPSRFLNDGTNTAPQVSEPAPVIEKPVVQPEVSKPLEDIKVDVQRYEVHGAPADALEDIQKRLQPYLGKGKSFEDLSNAARVVAAYLQSERGLYLAYAYLPAQKIQDGAIQIEVLPGVLDKVEVIWPDDLRVDRKVVQAHLDALKPGTVIRVSEIERVVFLLNDLRGIKVSFAIKLGDKPGTATLVASPVSTPAVTGKLGFDANGSRFAGTYRGIASVNWDSPFGIGDSFALSHLASTTGGLDFTLLGYTMPLGANGLKVGANVSYVDYSLSQNDFPLGLNGDAESMGLFALYPLKRSRNLNLFSLVSFDQKKFTDRQDLANSHTSKDIGVTKLGLSGDSRDSLLGGGLNFFELGLENSDVSYVTARPAGLDDDSRTKKITYSVGRLQSVIPNELMLWTYVRGQHAFDNLDSTDQCSLGGSEGVRAFAQGEASGDSCTLVTLEARHLLSANWMGMAAREVSLNVFYDYGETRFRHDPSRRSPSFVNQSVLAGYGVGLVWERSQEFTFNVSFAWEEKGLRQSDPKPQTPRIFASVNHSF